MYRLNTTNYGCFPSHIKQTALFRANHTFVEEFAINRLMFIEFFCFSPKLASYFFLLTGRIICSTGLYMVISADNLLYADEVLIMDANFKSFFNSQMF